MPTPMIRSAHRIPVLSSGRVVLVPLSADDLEVWIEDHCRLASDLKARLAMGAPDRLMRAVFQRKIEKMRARPSSSIWAAYWAIAIEDKGPVVAGLVGFKGLPPGSTEIEVGYGIEPPYRSRGFMKEALGLLVDWARAQRVVSQVVATTDSKNEASIKVLRSCDFAVEATEGFMMRWVRQLPLRYPC